MTLTRPRQRAFTLLELLMVLAVVAVLAGFAAPRLAGSLKGQRLDAQARTVIALARKARALASAEGRSYELVFDPSAQTVRLARQRDPLAAPNDPEDPEREALATDLEWARPLPFEEGVTLREAAGAQGESLDLGQQFTIRFYPDGSADARQVAFQIGTRTLRVEVRPHLGRAVLIEAATDAESSS